VQRRIGV